jgi:hypothetical protein
MTTITPDWSVNPQLKKPEVGQENQFARAHGLKTRNVNITTTKIVISDGSNDRILIGEF